MSRPVRRHRHRLYFFPALLPLAEVVPLVLTAIGALAGATGLARQNGRKILAAAFLCFAVAGGIVVAAMPDKEVRHEGTRAISAELFPEVIVMPAAAPPQDMVPEDIAPLAHFTDLWSVRVERQLLSTPVISQGALIVGTYKNTVEAYDIENGALLWHFRQDEPVYTIGRGRGDIIYAGEGLHHTQSAALTAFSARNGKIHWQREFLGHIESPPLVSDDGKQIWFPAGPGGLWSLRAGDGGVIWHNPVGHIDSTPARAGKMIFAAAQPDENITKSVLYALSADDGSLRWKAALPGQPWGRPAVSHDGRALLTSTGIGQVGVKKETDRGWAMALSIRNGEVLWLRKLDDMAIEPGSYLPEADLVFHTLKNGTIAALRGADGSPVWEARIGAEFMAPAVLIPRGGKPALLAATTADGVFTLREAATGAEVARRMVQKGASSSPVAAGDRIYVATPYRLYAFGGLGAL